MYRPHFAYPFICQWTSDFSLLANVNNPAINIGVQISVHVLKGQFLIYRSLQLSRLKKNLT